MSTLASVADELGINLLIADYLDVFEEAKAFAFEDFEKMDDEL